MALVDFLNGQIRVLMWLIQFLARWLFMLRCFLFMGLPKKQPPIKNLTLVDSASTLALKIRKRQISSEEVVRAFIARIQEIQPVLNCVAEERFGPALEEARKCDELLKSPDAPSADELAKDKPLFGVPFSVKECIGVEKMKQTAGLVCRANARAEKDGDCVRLMRQAGGIPLVTTNISELAMWWESYNCVYGITKNPYNTWHTVGGSTGGEGCLLASAGSPCGLGSDIGGSIRIPSLFNGIFGHKPSTGIVSRKGEYPGCSTQDQDEMCVNGPMSRHAEDLTLMMRVIAGENAEKLKLQSQVDTSKLKIYYMDEEENCPLTTPVDPEIKNSLKLAVQHLEKAYSVKATRVNVSALKNSMDIWMAYMTVPAEIGMSYDLTDRKYRLDLAREFLKWFFGSSEHTLAALLTAAFEALTAKFGNPEEQKRFKLEGQKLRHEFHDMLGDCGIFIYPTHPTAAPLHFEPLVKPFNWTYTGIINVLGLPATACPLGLNKDGLPIGIQIVSGLYQDRLSLMVAEELERAFRGWVPPTVEI